MSILSELKTLIEAKSVPVETGAHTSEPKDTYCVLTPMVDDFFFADDRPDFETNEVRISLFCKGNYIQTVKGIVNALIQADFTITDRRYLEYETETGYYHYVIDVAKEYKFEEEI